MNNGDQTGYPLNGWYPKAVEVNKELLCSWFFAGDVPFNRPFFTESMLDCRSRLPFDRLRTSSLSSPVLLPEWAKPIHSVAPSALIFHVSRCGSTLATQMLAINKQHIVLSEVPFLNDLLLNQAELSARYAVDFDDLLMAAIRFYGQKRSGGETHFFIKTDCWHILFYDQLRLMFPSVPFIFMYRRPDEVLRSHQKIRGIQAVPGLIPPETYGFTRDMITNMTHDDYLGLVLEAFFKKMLTISKQDAFATFIDYAEGTDAILKRIAGATGLQTGDGQLTGYMERARYHSKHPDQVFGQEEPVGSVPEAVAPAFASYLKLRSGL